MDLLPALGTDPCFILLDISGTYFYVLVAFCRYTPFSGHGYVNAAVDMMS